MTTFFQNLSRESPTPKMISEDVSIPAAERLESVQRRHPPLLLCPKLRPVFLLLHNMKMSEHVLLKISISKFSKWCEKSWKISEQKRTLGEIRTSGNRWEDCELRSVSARPASLKTSRPRGSWAVGTKPQLPRVSATTRSHPGPALRCHASARAISLPRCTMAKAPCK